MSKWYWLLSQLRRKLWFRTCFFAFIAVISALASIFLKPVIPSNISGLVGFDAVDKILNILASSMLAVTTFSLNIMVSAYSSATTNVTPRATLLIMEDSTTQNVLATFIGSFLFSLISIIALSMGVYGEQGRVLLFVVTLFVIVLIVITLLRWIQHLSLLGRVGETTSRVEDVTRNALERYIKNPFLGANPWPSTINLQKGFVYVYPRDIGYIQHIDMQMLDDYAKSIGGKIYLECKTGAFVHYGQPIALILSSKRDIDPEELLGAITIRSERSFDQDPRFGLSVLAEIASRALSPAVNDPGTAIDVIGRGVRLLAMWGMKSPKQERVIFSNIYVKPIVTADLFDDVFYPIARDGAALIEVQLRLVKGFLALHQINSEIFSDDVHRYILIVRKFAETQMVSQADCDKLREWILKSGLNRPGNLRD